MTNPYEKSLAQHGREALAYEAKMESLGKGHNKRFWDSEQRKHDAALALKEHQQKHWKEK